MLSAIQDIAPECRFYFAASSEMFGKANETPQNEETRFHPRSPYGISKVAGFDLARNFRESYGLFACNGISFNHESPRKGCEYVTRKTTSTIARIKVGLDKELRLGNLEAKRDWRVAGDYDKAKRIPGWEPAVRFRELLKMMVLSDVNNRKFLKTAKEQLT